MKKLNQQKAVQISGGAYECTKIEGNTIKIYFFIEGAHQLNGWLVAGGLTGHISCHEL